MSTSKRIKAIMAFLTAMTMTAGAMGVTAYANEVHRDFWVDGPIEGLREAANQINDFIKENEIDAQCFHCVRGYKDDDSISDEERVRLDIVVDWTTTWGGEEFIDITYLTENDKAKIEEYIKDNNIDTAHIKMNEMKNNNQHDEKAMYLSNYILPNYIFDNHLALDYNFKQFDNGDWGFVIKYYLSHEQDKKIMEKYLAEKGYNKAVPVEYEFIGDPDADPATVISDINEISSLLSQFADDNGLHTRRRPTQASPTQILKDGKVHMNIGGDQCDIDTELVKKFMTEKNIDQSLVVLSCDGGRVAGDANSDNKADVRDCAEIAKRLAKGDGGTLPDEADYNADQKKNIRDAAALSSDLAAK